uniref:transcriptional regulator FtsR n=1 Tax=Devriesea agamarum TaxID=472569 RepID=UPI001E587235|nr:MerR family transcriptional regulator [Devriesea agamarum]
MLELVRDEFPELTHSKLHFLEAQGLITPDRTPSGYRKYSRDDVDTLLFVLRAQRDRFWPLKVIKEHLATNGPSSEVTSIARHSGPSAQPVRVKFDRVGMCREAQIDEEFLAELEEFGFLPRRGLFFGQADVEIARAARELADEGLHPRHLVMVRTAVGRQAHMLRSVAEPRKNRKSADAHGEAETVAHDLGESLITLHNALLRVTLDVAQE